MSVIELNTKGRKIFAIIWALLEIFFFAGLFFGWGTLVFMLKEDGVYSSKCMEEINGHHGNITLSSVIGYDTKNTPKTGYTLDINATDTYTGNDYQESAIHKRRIGCPEQDKIFNLGFSIVSGLWPYFYGLLGQLGHKFGTRFLRISSILSFMIGSVLVAFTTPDLPWLAFLGLFLYGVSGCGLLFSNFQLSYLFQRGRTLVSGLMTGSFDSSIATQLYIKIGYDNGIPRKYCYIFIACLHAVTFISTFLWLPKSYIKLPELTKEETIIVKVKDIDKKNANIDQMTELNGNIKDFDQDSVENGCREIQTGDDEDFSTPLKHQSDQKADQAVSLRGLVCSQVYLLHIYWYSVLQLRFFYFVGTLNPWLERVSKSEEEVSRYTNISMYCMMGGIVTSIMAGLFFDMQKQRFKDCKDPRKRKLGPVVLPLAVGTALGMLVTIMQMIPSQFAIYASCISLTAFRSFLYAIGNGYLSEMFPSKYFSSLSGLLMVLTGSAGFLQYLFFYWTESYPSAFMHVNIALLCLILTSLVHPVYQWIQCRKSA